MLQPNRLHAPWFVTRKPNPNAYLRLFCFPYSGAGASVYNSWIERLPATIELCAVQLPGRETRLAEPPHQELSTLVEAVATALLPYTNQPFAFFGHSMGALLSFELTRYLRSHHHIQPLHLFVSGHSAPQLDRMQPPIHDLPDPELIQELRRYNGTPEAVFAHPELLNMLLPILRADFALYETYAYRPDAPLNCPLSVFGGLQDREAPYERLEPWRAQTRGTCALEMFPGDHFYFNHESTLFFQSFARQLQDTAEKAAVRAYW